MKILCRYCGKDDLVKNGHSEKSGKNPEPSAAIIDSQSVKSSQVSDTKGFDGNKKTEGRKRHLVVDTLGFPLIAEVHDANLPDGKQAIALMETLVFWFGTIKMIWADAAYRGELAVCLLLYVPLTGNRSAPKSKGFQVVPKRWIIERTFGWFRWKSDSF